MTIEGWSLDAAWKGLSYVGGKLMEYTNKTPNDDDELDTQVEPVDLTKLVESISGSIFIGMLAMMPEQTKIHVEDNAIKFDAPWLLQGWYRTGVASRKDFKKYKIFHRCITMPQGWYPDGSDEAKAIARIHKITILGMEMIRTMYKDDYVPDHVKKYTKSAKQFIRRNDVDDFFIEQSPPMPPLRKDKTTMVQQDHQDGSILIEVVDRKQQDHQDNTVVVDHDKIIEKEKLAEKDGHVTLIEKQQLQDSSFEVDLESGLEQNKKVVSDQQPEIDSDYDSDDDLLSEISDEDKNAAAFAMDSNSSNIMKSLYSKKELISFADRLETAWEHHQSSDKLVKEQVAGELKAITQSLVTKIKLYQKKMNQDLRDRY